jgi:hypothetical protein
MLYGVIVLRMIDVGVVSRLLDRGIVSRLLDVGGRSRFDEWLVRPFRLYDI